MMTASHSSAPLLVFDLDGTLYRTESSFVRTMRRVYGHHAIPYPGDAAILAMVGETFATFLDWLLRQGFPGDADTLQAEIACLERIAIRSHGELYAGVPETLRELARRGCALALCTNGDRRYVDIVLARGGIERAFDQLSTLEAGGASKTERVGELVRHFGRGVSIVVGDRSHDVIAARANGCRMVGALYGYARDGELDRADARISSFPELLDVVTRLA